MLKVWHIQRLTLKVPKLKKDELASSMDGVAHNELMKTRFFGFGLKGK